jgi:hypothetical protein
MKYKNLTVNFKTHPDSLAHSEQFTNAVLMLSGDHLVITEHDEDGSSITGKVFPLTMIDSYKAGKE